MNDPFALMQAQRRALVDRYTGNIKESRVDGRFKPSRWTRGLLCGYKIALGQARALLKGIRAKKAQGWCLMWVRADLVKEVKSVFDKDIWHEAQID